MLRLLFIIALSTMSSLAFAEMPSLFEIAPEDVSVYYLGEIFGKNLVPGGAETFLLSDIFEIFNAVCLTVAIIIIIYTMIVGVLETAGQGKVLGEKWSATWLPIRIMLGIALLVPNAGSGYVLAQSMVMWMGLQGVGAADTIWNKTLDYFIEGGSIRAKETGSTQSNYSASYMNKQTVDSTYLLEQAITENVTCIAANNASEDNVKIYGKYEVYQSDDYYHLYFGNPDTFDPETNEGGRECGYIVVPTGAVAQTEPMPLDPIAQTYNDAFYAMARSLEDLAIFLAGENGTGVGGDNKPEWEKYFLNPIQYSSVSFIETLNAASHILYPDQDNTVSGREGLEELKKFGWILAGNYYMTLSNYEDKLQGIKLVISDSTIEEPEDAVKERYKNAIQNAVNFWGDQQNPAEYTFWAWDGKYIIEGHGDVSGKTGTEPENLSKLDRKDLNDIKKNLSQIGTMAHTGDADTMDPLFYLSELTGFSKDSDSGGLAVQDPILRAAAYGGKLTAIATEMLAISMAAFLVLGIAAGFSAGPCYTATPVGQMLATMFFAITAPLIFGIVGFLYVQGALLSVALPLIPFVIFFTAAIGWFIAMIEMVVVAPLAAVGLIFPEANQDIWGKAEPVYMMILNLFLRPPLIIIGFVAGMILTWVAIELLNAAFYFFIIDAAQIENHFFGYIVVTLAYIGILITIVEKTFSLTTELPNNVLKVLGDRTRDQPGAEAMLQGAKGGVEKGGQAVAGFASGAGSAAERAGSAGLAMASSPERKAEQEKKDKQKEEVLKGKK
ncbi:MAG: DotA/TraY family protein [Legionellales bacterium]|jgi:conjugal transfer/type IV secretion protein DotA/TraY